MNQNQGNYVTMKEEYPPSYPQAEYPTQPGFSPPPSYPQQSGYPMQPGYPAQPDFPAQPSYPTQPGFSQQAGSPPQPGFPIQPPASGSPPQPGYPKQGDTSAYPADMFPTPPQEEPGYPPSADIGEDGFGFKNLDFTEKSIRRSFIRKVYGILMCQLLVTLGFIALFLFHKGTKQWVQENSAVTIIAVVVTFVCIICISCFTEIRRRTPMNFIFLSIFTVAMSFMLGVATSQFDVATVMMAVGITAGVCLALTLFAFQSRWDFTTMGGALLCILVIFVLCGFIKFFLPYTKTMELVYSGIGALIFSMYLVYDTQLMMGGDHKYTITPEEYIFAALNLYLDVINLFIYILRIIAASK